MRKMLAVLLWPLVLALVASVVLAGSEFSDLKPLTGYYTKLRLNEDSWTGRPGPAEVVVSVVTEPYCKLRSFEVQIAEHEGLTVLDYSPRSFELEPGDSAEITISLDVPPEGLNHLVVEVVTDIGKGRQFCTFKADSVAVEFIDHYVVPKREVPEQYRDNLRPSERARLENERLDSIARSRPRTALIQLIRGMDGEWYYPDSLPEDFEPWDEAEARARKYSLQRAAMDTTMTWLTIPGQGAVLVPKDSLRREDERRQREKRLQEMKEMEKTPCNTGMQRFQLGDQVYARRRGETKFQLQQSVQDIPAFIDSFELAHRPATEPTYHVVVDLSDPDDSLLVDQMVDSLIPFKDAHLYEIVVSRSDFDKIQRAGVPWNHCPKKPSEGLLSPPRRMKQPSSSESGMLDTRGSIEIMSANFEDGITLAFVVWWPIPSTGGITRAFIVR